jgi:ABC-type multidrug transport system fused ATPase/permease subunit
MTRLILDLIRPYRWIIAVILTAMLVQTAMSLAGPWPLKIILDNVVVAKHPLPQWMTNLLPALGGKSKFHIAELAAIIFVLIAALNAIASYIANYYSESVGQWVAYDAYNIIVLKDGVVAETGTHEQLLNFNGVYAGLHRIQYQETSA